MKHSTAPQRWAMLVSALVGLIGLQWWALPDTYPFGAPGESFASVGSRTAAAVAGALGVTGIVTAWALGRRSVRRLASASAVVQVIILGTVWQRGAGDVDTDSLYALGALIAGALWLLALIHDEPSAHEERIAAAPNVRTPIGWRSSPTRRWENMPEITDSRRDRADRDTKCGQ